MQTWNTHDGPVVSVAFSPDGRRLAAAGRNTVTVHTLADDHEVTIGHRCLRQVAFTPDGRHIISDGGNVNALCAYDADTREESVLAQPDGHSWVFAFDPAGRVAVYSVIEMMSQNLQWYSFTEGRWVETWEDLSPTGGYALKFSPDGRLLALPSYYALTLWDVKTRKTVAAQYVLPEGPKVMLDFAPDGSRVVCGAGRRLAVLDLALKPVAVLQSGRSHFTDVAFHPSGRYLAATSNDGGVRLYDAATWAVAKTFTWNVGKLRSVAFSPDGLLAAAGSDTGKVVVWDVDA